MKNEEHKKRALPHYYWDKALKLTGAEGRNRTDMGLPPLDFESSASTSFTTPAVESLLIPHLAVYRQGQKVVGLIWS